MVRNVERHKRGWAAVEITTYGHTVFKTVVGVYKTKAEAAGHWDE
jgi:hypothetical protein